jgi:hypothetical protein
VIRRFVVLLRLGGVEQADTITDAKGEARASWRLSTVPAQNVLSVYLPNRAGGLAFSAAVAAGPATGIRREALGVLDAVAFAHESLAGAAVVVHDRFGNPTTGTQVEFAVTQGGGSLGGRTAWRVDVTQSGVAQPPQPWTLGQPGLNTLVATLAEGPSVAFDVFVLDSASVSWFVTQTTGTSRQKLALSASGHFVHEFWNGESVGPRFTGRYEIVAGKINLSGCVLDWYYGHVCYSSVGDIVNDVITLYGKSYTKSL